MFCRPVIWKRGKLMMAKHGIKVAVFALTVYACGLAPAAMLSPGDIVVAAFGELSDEGDGALIKINPVTGNRTIISGPGVGSGPGFDPHGVAVATMNDIFVVEPFEPLSTESFVYHVDVATGNRQVIASSTVGTGPVIQLPADVIVRNDGKLIVSDASSDSLVLVDPVTLERSILSGSGVGNGPNFLSPIGMAFDVNGDILVTTVEPLAGTSALFRVNALTGDREIVSADDMGSGPGPDFWSDVVVDGDGRVLVTNFDGPLQQSRGVLSVDLMTGDRAIVSALGTGVGPTLIQPWGIGIEADGNILVTNESFPIEDSLIRIDPATGDRTIVSGFGVGSGPNLQNPQFFDIVQVPEPSTAFLFITGLIFVVLAGCSRRSSRPAGLLLR